MLYVISISTGHENAMIHVGIQDFKNSVNRHKLVLGNVDRRLNFRYIRFAKWPHAQDVSKPKMYEDKVTDCSPFHVDGYRARSRIVTTVSFGITTVTSLSLPAYKMPGLRSIPPSPKFQTSASARALARFAQTWRVALTILLRSIPYLLLDSLFFTSLHLKFQVVAQKLKQEEVTEQNSLLLTRNLLRIAIFNISYIRGLFPEQYFNDKSVPALDMKIKKLMPMDVESRRLIDWMEKGVYDALQRKYLKMLVFCICEAIDGAMIEEYAFSFSYSSSDREEVSMNVNRIGDKKQGATFKANTPEITPNQMRSDACKMVRTLVQLMRTLDRMPEELSSSLIN
ncbi:hypothetical protein ACLOJK_017135 [Asimina triloba]